MTLDEFRARVEKLRVAQKRAIEPAAYAHPGDASTAAIYASMVDEALDELARAADVRASTSVEEVPE